jgi:hypothetical protein
VNVEFAIMEYATANLVLLVINVKLNLVKKIALIMENVLMVFANVTLATEEIFVKKNIAIITAVEMDIVTIITVIVIKIGSV